MSQKDITKYQVSFLKFITTSPKKFSGLRRVDMSQSHTDWIGPAASYHEIQSITRMCIMDNILFSTKKEIMTNFPIESTRGIDVLPTLMTKRVMCIT